MLEFAAFCLLSPSSLPTIGDDRREKKKVKAFDGGGGGGGGGDGGGDGDGHRRMRQSPESRGNSYEASATDPLR